MALSVFSTTPRITSYNVCYTKLLRSKESVTSRLNELERLLRAFGEEVRQSDIQESGLAIEQLEIAKGYLVDCLQSMPNPSLNQLDFSKEAAEQRRVALRTLREEIGRRKNKIDFIQSYNFV